MKLPPGSPTAPLRKARLHSHKSSRQIEPTAAEHDSMRAAAGPLLLLLLSSAAAAESGSSCTAIGENVRETGAFVACCDTLLLLDVSPPNSEVPVYVCASQPSGDPAPSGTPTPTTSPSPKPSPSPTPPTGGRCAVYHSTASPPPTCLICDKAQKRKVCVDVGSKPGWPARGRAQAADWLRTVGA